MRIQHNIAAMNSYRNYVGNNSALSRNLEKLSSGYRINRAGDDAAGLAISEKMRAQISGLDQAQSNVKDGISLVKTAEGALQEVQDMMNRMVTLATQSANGTYQDAVDRENLQAEVDALKKEIDRIAESSNFNGQKLLNGDLAAAVEGSVTTTIGAEGTEIQDKLFTPSKLTKATINATPAEQTFTIGDLTNSKNAAIKVDFTDDEGNKHSFTLVSNAAITSTTDNGVDDGALLEDALTGAGQFTLSVTGDATNEGGKAFDLFKDLFGTVTNNNDGTVTVKNTNAASTATINSIKVEDGVNDLTDATLDALAFPTKLVSESTAAKAAQTVYTVDTTSTDSVHSITIGDKVYSYKATAASEEDEAAAALVEQLKADGYDVTQVDKTTGNEDTAAGTAIKFNDPSQLQEVQKGAQITNASDDIWTVTGTVGSTGKTVVTMGAPAEANADQEFTITYMNADNESVTKTFTYNTGDNTDADDAATSLVNAMKADKEFAAAFKITDNSNGTFDLDNLGSGSAYGVTAYSTNDTAGATAVITKGTEVGKELDLEAGKNIAKGDQITIDGKTYQFVNDLSATVDEGVVKVMMGTNNADSMKSLSDALKKNGVENTYDSGKLTFADKKVDVTEATEDGGLTLQIGDTAEKHNQLNVSIEDMHTKALGIADINIGNIKGAQEAIETIKTAINKVSSTRGNLGAIQNRLEHTQNNLSVMTENIQDAESTIRDTDIADEMTTYTKNNILLQSAQAMLAQANQMPQGVLQLLQ